MTDLAHHFADSGSGPIHYVAAGSGPTVVLLHGFPEFWYAWREQIPVLAAEGYRAVAPDLRGYNLSHKPRRLSRYRIGEVAEEIAELIGTVAPGERVALVGHDWGALVAWIVAMRSPDRLGRLTILAVPHPSSFRALARRPLAALRFWYQAAAQPPWIPEIALRAGRYAALKRAMRSLSKRREALTPEVLATYESAWAQPGALTGMLDYYRAFHRRPHDLPRRRDRTVSVPTLMIHGARDRYFAADLFEASARWAPDSRLERVSGAGHFLQHDRPERVNELLIEFLRSS